MWEPSDIAPAIDTADVEGERKTRVGSAGRNQRRFREDSEILALFFEPESPESSPRTFLSGLYVPHSQWG